LNSKSLIAILFLLSLSLLSTRVFASYAPHQGDYFSYNETQTLSNGTGDYSGYSEQTTITGTETVNGINPDGNVSTSYSWTSSWSSSDGGTETNSSSGTFTFSPLTFLYVNGTDDQTGYVNPTVWFYIDNSIPKGGTFYLLNTLMTVTNENYSYFLPPENRSVYAISTIGSSNYQRNDAYGQFTATYTWNAYFDPASGYIIGYNYVEQDTNPSGTGFTYTETLYINSASYSLTTAPTNNQNGGNLNLTQYAGYIAAAIIIAVIAIIAYAASRRRKLPKHPSQQLVYTPPTAPPPPPQDIDLTPKQPSVQQVVIKEVVKVKCRYCGALIDSTAEKCPFCGAPRT
jgi:hypothetical protein